jgi:hypothetical protein
VTTVDPNDTEALSERVDELAPANLAVPRRTHFSSLAVVPQLPQTFLRKDETADPTGLLMFTAVFDARGNQERDEALDDYLTDLHGRLGDADANEIWGKPFEGPESFSAHLREHELPTDMPFATYPGRTVMEVREALEVAREFARLANGVQGRDPATLKRRWNEFRGRRRAAAREAWAEVA